MFYHQKRTLTDFLLDEVHPNVCTLHLPNLHAALFFNEKHLAFNRLSEDARNKYSVPAFSCSLLSPSYSSKATNTFSLLLGSWSVETYYAQCLKPYTDLSILMSLQALLGEMAVGHKAE